MRFFSFYLSVFFGGADTKNQKKSTRTTQKKIMKNQRKEKKKRPPRVLPRRLEKRFFYFKRNREKKKQTHTKTNKRKENETLDPTRRRFTPNVLKNPRDGKVRRRQDRTWSWVRPAAAMEQLRGVAKCRHLEGHEERPKMQGCRVCKNLQRADDATRRAELWNVRSGRSLFAPRRHAPRVRFQLENWMESQRTCRT